VLDALDMQEMFSIHKKHRLYPFYEDEGSKFEESASALSVALEAVLPFDALTVSASCFLRKRKSTVYAVPEPVSAG
jgi:hypothetical protein